MSTFSLLFVCTGNMCRSPIAERLASLVLARHLRAEAGRFRVSSAGTRTYVGAPMTPEAAAVVAAYGGDPEGFTSAELSARDVAAADLVLTATRAHRSAVVTLDPTALRRTFTLTEFARTARCGAPAPDLVAAATAGPVPPAALPDDPVERARAVVAAAARWRGTVRPPRPEDDDIPDPIGHSTSVYEKTGTTIMHAVNTAVAALVGGRL